MWSSFQNDSVLKSVSDTVGKKEMKQFKKAIDLQLSSFNLPPISSTVTIITVFLTVILTLTSIAVSLCIVAKEIV